MTDPTATPAAVRILDVAEAGRRVDELADILVDAVAGGASVNFMAGFDRDGARAFWKGQGPGLASGERRLLVGEAGGRLVATAVLSIASQPNAPHRAEVGKMLVLTSERRRGWGRRLLAAVEADAAALGRTLLMLDTETGSGGDALYRSCGWTAIGGVPDHAYRPDGRLAETTLYYKRLGGSPARPA